jgi:hypothetical protein
MYQGNTRRKIVEERRKIGRREKEGLRNMYEE